MVPALIASRIAALRDAVRAAEPFERQPPLQAVALIAQGRGVVSALDQAVAGTGGPLDAGDPTGFSGRFGTVLAALGETALTHSALVDARGYVGRAVFNLEQAQP